MDEIVRQQKKLLVLVLLPNVARTTMVVSSIPTMAWHKFLWTDGGRHSRMKMQRGQNNNVPPIGTMNTPKTLSVIPICYGRYDGHDDDDDKTTTKTTNHTERPLRLLAIQPY
jgi:hypothetical protein